MANQELVQVMDQGEELQREQIQGEPVQGAESQSEQARSERARSEQARSGQTQREQGERAQRAETQREQAEREQAEGAQIEAARTETAHWDEAQWDESQWDRAEPAGGRWQQMGQDGASGGDHRSIASRRPGGYGGGHRRAGRPAHRCPPSGRRRGRPERGRRGALEVAERAENFPVALWLLPRRRRRHLRAIYAVARTIDDLGDRAEGDRTALLRAFATDLSALWSAAAADPVALPSAAAAAATGHLLRPPAPDAAAGPPWADVVRGLAPTVRELGLAREPFERLVEANLRDQAVTSYSSFDDLLGYCALSAHPIGHLVLAVFGVDDPAAIELSDRICAALQLIEHWQDVAEDRRAGRVYLPKRDLDDFRVPAGDLDRPATSPALRRLIAFEVDRAAELLAAGTPLVARLRGWARLAVAGYVAGGEAAIDALRRAHGAVLEGAPRPRRRDIARHLARHLVRAWWADRAPVRAERAALGRAPVRAERAALGRAPVRAERAAVGALPPVPAKTGAAKRAAATVRKACARGVARARSIRARVRGRGAS